MAMKPADVFTRVADAIHDIGHVRWPVEELLRYLNDGRREIAIVRPDLYSRVSVVSLASGTEQTVPATSTRFMDAICNINPDNSPGRAVRVCERELLDVQDPDWHTRAPGTPRQYMFDERYPRIFHVTPPAAAGAKLKIVTAITPVDIALGDINTTELTDEGDYAGALIDYVAFRAISKDAEYAGNAGRAATFYNRFVQVLGAGAARTLQASPNSANIGGSPPKIAGA